MGIIELGRRIRTSKTVPVWTSRKVVNSVSAIGDGFLTTFVRLHQSGRLTSEEYLRITKQFR